MKKLIFAISLFLLASLPAYTKEITTFLKSDLKFKSTDSVELPLNLPTYSSLAIIGKDINSPTHIQFNQEINGETKLMELPIEKILTDVFDGTLMICTSKFVKDKNGKNTKIQILGSRDYGSDIPEFVGYDLFSVMVTERSDGKETNSFYKSK